MRRGTAVGRLSIAVVAAAAVVAGSCVPPTGDQWRSGDRLLRGHVVLSDSQHSSATVVAPAENGGVLVARMEEYFDAVGEPVGATLKATRFRANGGVRYDVDLGLRTVNAVASALGRDYFAGWLYNPNHVGGRSELLALTPNGARDLSFGDGGVVTFERPAEPDTLPWGYWPAAVPEAVAVDSVGRVYVALTAHDGFDTAPPSYQVDAWVTRLAPDGQLDTDYGVDGAAYIGRVGRLSGDRERRGLLDVGVDGAVTVALGSESRVGVFWVQPEGVAAQRLYVDAGRSPTGTDGWRTSVEPTGLHRSNGRTMVVLAPSMRVYDPGVVAIDESAVFGGDDVVDPSDVLDESFGENGVLAWRVDGSYHHPPMTAPVVSVGGIREHADGTFTVPVLNQQGHPGVVSFDAQGRLLHPQRPGGVTVVRTADRPNLQFGTTNWFGPPGWIPSPDEVEGRNGALRAAWSDGWHLVGVDVVEAGGELRRDGLAVLRVRDGVR